MNNHKRSREAEERRLAYVELRKRSKYDRIEKEHLSTSDYWTEIEVTSPTYAKRGIDSILMNVQVGEVLQDRHGQGTVQLLGGDLD